MRATLGECLVDRGRLAGIGRARRLDYRIELARIAGIRRCLDHQPDGFGQALRICRHSGTGQQRGGYQPDYGWASYGLGHTHDGDPLTAQSRSFQPVLKITAMIATHATRKAMVIASDTPMGKSDVPVKVQRKPLTR